MSSAICAISIHGILTRIYSRTDSDGYVTITCPCNNFTVKYWPDGILQPPSRALEFHYTHCPSAKVQE